MRRSSSLELYSIRRLPLPRAFMLSPPPGPLPIQARPGGDVDLQVDAVDRRALFLLARSLRMRSFSWRKAAPCGSSRFSSRSPRSSLRSWKVRNVYSPAASVSESTSKCRAGGSRHVDIDIDKSRHPFDKGRTVAKYVSVPVGIYFIGDIVASRLRALLTRNSNSGSLKHL